MSDNVNMPFGGGLANPAQVIVKQFVLVRNDMSTAFTDDEYNSCITALSSNLAVAVSFGTGGALRQAQLVSKTALGALTFSYTRNESVETWTVSAASPHTITNKAYDVGNSITPVMNTGTKIAEGTMNGQSFELFAPSGGGGDQFVLVRENMTTDFTNQEYQDCVDAVTAEQAVCVQFTMTGSTVQAQLTLITGDGTLVFEFTAENYHYRWKVDATNNAHAVELVGNIFGVPIFDTLQDAIASEYTLKSGDVFETNGFHTSGDGGAARYRVSSTGTANGMDIVQLAAGKLAVLQIDNKCSPEQIGYVYTDTSLDAVPYIDRIISMGVHDIILERKYRWKSTLTITTQGLNFRGLSAETSPSSSLINVILGTGVTKAIRLRTKCILFENLYFYNGKGTPTDEIAIDCDDLNNTSNNYKWQFTRLKFVSFHIGIHLNCTLPWHISLDDVMFGFCNYGFVSECNVTALSFTNVYCNGCYEKGVSICGMCQGLSFRQCNFGIQKNGVSFVKYGLFDNMEAVFIGCNFEIDTNAPIDNSSKDMFIYVDDNVKVTLEFVACNFVLTKSTLPSIPSGSRCISLGNQSTMKLTSCFIEATGSVNEQLINEARVPMDKVASIHVDSTTHNFAKPNFSLLYKHIVVDSNSEYNDNMITKVYDLTGTDPVTLDANSIMPDSNGKEIISEVSTFSGTTNLPSGFSGAGILHSCTFNAYTRCIQYFFATDGNCYTRRAIRDTTNDPWTWQTWKKFTSA